EKADNFSPAEVWLLRNKIDLLTGEGQARSERSTTNESARTFLLSALNGAGVESLTAELSARVSSFFSGAEAPMVTRARHRLALDDTISALDRATLHGPNGSEELVAEDLRSAATALGRLTGRVDVEDLLDVIFREFCI